MSLHNAHFLRHLPMAWGLPLPFVPSSQVQQLNHVSQGAQRPPTSGAPGTAWSHLVHEDEQKYGAPKGSSQKALPIHCPTGI